MSNDWSSRTTTISYRIVSVKPFKIFEAKSKIFLMVMMPNFIRIPNMALVWSSDLWIRTYGPLKVILGSKSIKTNWFEDFIMNMHDMHIKREQIWRWFFWDAYQGHLRSLRGHREVKIIKKLQKIDKLHMIRMEMTSTFRKWYF